MSRLRALQERRLGGWRTAWRVGDDGARPSDALRIASAALSLAVVGLLSGVAAQGAGAAVADERAVELVTPVGSTANIRVAGGITSIDGNTVCYATDDALLGSVGNGVGFLDDAFCAYRRESGWESKWLSGPQVEGEMGGIGSRVWYLSDDGSRAILGGTSLIAGFPDWTMSPENPEELPNGNATPNLSGFLYEDGALDWMNRRPLPLARDWGSGPVAASATLDHALFTSSRALVAEDQSDSVDPDAIFPPTDVYLWTHDGLQLVSVAEDGTDLGDAEIAVANVGTARQGSLSSDGSRAFFVSAVGAYGAPPRESVFRWEDGEVTLVSPRRGPEGTPPGYVTFAGASADGDVVYLHSTERLTSEPIGSTIARSLYRYQVSTDELDLVATGPSGVTPLAYSADGSTVVYNKGSVLYQNREGVESLITPLHPGDVSAQRVASVIEGARAVRISDDGRRVIFVSEVQTPDIAQVFLWEEGTGLRRVSSTAAGEPATSDATFGNYPDQAGLVTSETADFDQHWQWANRGRVWTDDTETVFFQTATALVPEDENEVVDVYEWRDGELSLVTPGTPGPTGFYYFASTPDGKTVFFITYRRVLPRLDRNVTRDVYAARVGGGFPDGPTGPAFGDPSGPAEPGVAPAAPGVESSMRRDGEQAIPRAVLRIERLPLRVSGGLAGKGRVGIRVAGAAGARIRVRAVARIRGTARTIGRATARLKAAETRVTVRLAKVARTQLARKRRMAVTLVVRGAGSPVKRLVVRLRLPANDVRKRG